MQETWKDVLGYEDRFMVSDCGRVFGKKSGKILKQSTTKDGYKTAPMIAYHASPVSISRFRCTEQGVHVGSLESALEAVSRKIGRNSEFYLHTVEVDTSQFVEEIDHGYDWRSIFEKEVDTVNGYVYSNRYEPSSKPSYVTWNPEETLKILDVSKKTLNDFRKKG